MRFRCHNFLCSPLSNVTMAAANVAPVDLLITPAKAVPDVVAETPVVPEAPKKAKAGAAKRGPKKRKLPSSPPVITAVGARGRERCSGPPARGSHGVQVSCLMQNGKPNTPFTRIMPYRKRTKKPDYKPVESSSIPGMTVGEVRKCLNQVSPSKYSCASCLFSAIVS